MMEEKIGEKESKEYRKNMVAWLKRERICITHVSKKAGYSESALSTVIRGALRLSRQHVDRISKALEFDSNVFFLCVPDMAAPSYFTRDVKNKSHIGVTQNKPAVKRKPALKNQYSEKFPTEDIVEGVFKYRGKKYEYMNGRLWYVDELKQHWPLDPSICKECEYRSSPKTGNAVCVWHEEHKDEFTRVINHGYYCDGFSKKTKGKRKPKNNSLRLCGSTSAGKS